MADHRGTTRDARRPGARKADAPARRGDVLTVAAATAPLDARTPIGPKRPKVSAQPRPDLTRVAGPIRLILEPMLWVAFVSGVFWALVLFDPAVRDPGPDTVVYEHALPLALLVGAMLLISSISALLWLGTSTSATKARTSFAGLGMLASGWLLTKLHPVDSSDLQGAAWLSVAFGVLLVALCSVQWPTRPAVVARRPGLLGWAVSALLLFLLVGAAVLAWEASQHGLVGHTPAGREGWEPLRPALGAMGLLLAGLRWVWQRPQRIDGA